MDLRKRVECRGRERSEPNEIGLFRPERRLETHQSHCRFAAHCLPPKSWPLSVASLNG